MIGAFHLGRRRSPQENSAMKTIATILAVAGALTVLATAAPARAQWDGRRDYRWHERGWREPHWHSWYRPYVYAPPPPVYYYAPPRYYAPPPPPVGYGFPIY